MTEPSVAEFLLLPPVGWGLAIVFGALWGSFFNVAIHRLGLEGARLLDIVRPPSHCPLCKTPIRARDNIPVLGWILLGGRCRACRAPISIRYPVVELCGAAIGAAVYLHFVLARPALPAVMVSRFIIYFFFVGVLFVLALIDLETMYLPEAITLPSIPLFFVLGRLMPDVPLVDAAIGLAVGFGALKALQLGYAAITGREGLGGGDAMLMAIVGGFLGWKALPFTLGLGSCIGTLVSVPLLLVSRRRRRRDAAMQKINVAVQRKEDASQPDGPHGLDGLEKLDEGAEKSFRHLEVPFGPFLVAGALLYLFFKDAAWAWLMGVADVP